MKKYFRNCLNSLRNKPQKAGAGVQKKEGGQSLIEYLVLVAIVAIGSLAVLRVLGKNLHVQLGNVARVLAGEESSQIKGEKVRGKHYGKRDFSNFMRGAVTEEKSDSSK